MYPFCTDSRSHRPSSWPALLCAAAMLTACGAEATDVGDDVDAAADTLSGDTAALDATSSDGVGSDAADGAASAVQPVPNIAALTGPLATLFDCTTKGVPKTRLAAAPLSCVLTPGCSARLVVGHRGAGGEFAQIAPENSLAAIRAALWMGQDGVELDVRHTADDQLVVMHDGSVDRTTDGTGSVSGMTLSAVTAMKLKGENGSHVVYGGDFSCERVPSLAEAFALTKDRLFVDLDTKTDRIDLVVAAIVAAGVIDQVFVSVPDPTSAAKARALNPLIRVQIRATGPEHVAAALKLFPERPPEVVEIPSTAVETLAPLAHKVGAKVFTNGFPVDAQQMVLGSQSAAYLKLFSIGCDIVQTEFPGAVLQALGRATAPK